MDDLLAMTALVVTSASANQGVDQEPRAKILVVGYGYDGCCCGHGCPDGVDRLVRTLYHDDVRSGFWEKSISRYRRYFDEDIFVKLLDVSMGRLPMRIKGYALVDVDIFSGTQWGTDGIKSLKCQSSIMIRSMRISSFFLVGSGVSLSILSLFSSSEIPWSKVNGRCQTLVLIKILRLRVAMGIYCLRH